MRRSVFVAILAGTLSFAACSDQPTEVPNRPEPPQVSPDVGTAPCTLNQLIDLAAKLFPAGPRRTAIVLALKGLPQNRQLRLAAAIKRAAFGIIDIVTRAYRAGLLVKSPDTPANLLAFIQGMYCFVPLGTPPPTPPGPIDPNEFTTAVITSTSGPMDVVVPSQHGGLIFQGVTLPLGVPAVTVFVNKLADSPGPLLTSLDQFPLFYEFSVFPDVTFTKEVIAAVCLGNNFPLGSSLRLAHNVGSIFGDVDILPFVNPRILNCTNIPATLPTFGLFGGVRGLFASVFLPAPLHATTSLLETLKIGGSLKHLSPFGSVRPGSNPGSLSIVDQTGEPTSGNVSGPGPVTVYVKAASQNGAPIQKVPVTFDGEITVPTDEDGIASFLWEATPGTTLIATVPNEANEVAPSCPSGIPAHGPTDAYRPLVCFTPSSVVFSAVVAFGFESGEPVWTPTGFWNSSTLKGPTGASLTNTASPELVTTVGDALPTPFAGSFSAWYGQASTGNYIGTQAGSNLGGTSTEPNTGSLVSPLFTVPDVPGVELRFRTWWEIESVNPATFDLMQVRINAGGAPGAGTLLKQLNPTADPGTTSSALPYTSAGFNTAPAWKEIAVDLSAYRGQTAQLRFVFDTRDVLYNGFRGWIVDEVLVLDATGLVPPASLKLSPLQGPASTIDPNTVPARTWRP